MRRNVAFFLIGCTFVSFLTFSCKREKLFSAEQQKLDDLLALSNGQMKIPDFSFAGYKQNTAPLPDIPVAITVEPGAGNDGPRIQAAINKVSSMPLVNGYRGAVLLKAGSYQVGDQLFITASGVVLRGEGQSDSGTVITSTKVISAATEFVFIKLLGNTNGITESGTKTLIDAGSAVPVGSVRIPVASSSGYSVGDTIAVVKTPNDNWINTLGMAQYGWTAPAYKVPHLRVVTKLESNAILVDIPLVDAIENTYGGGYITHASVTGRISNSGVENLRLKSVYASDEDENHAWTAIQFYGVTNCWLKKVTAQNFASGCIDIANQSDFNTVQDCAFLDPKSRPVGGRRYSFQIVGGLGNLIQRCFTRGGRHDFVTSARVTGPNVYLDCLATETLDHIGPHHRWATGILFDNVTGGQLRAINRRDAGTGQGWTGAQIMFWNCTATIDWAIFSPPTGTNWAIGCKGIQQTGGGVYILHEHQLPTRSIFLSQLEQRLGSQAVINVTTDAQRTGSITESLRQWAGN